MAARPLTLADVIEAMAEAVPDRIAIHTLDQTYTFAEIDERSTRLANHLISLGVQPGDHVAVHSHNRIEWVDAFYGALKARAVPININYKYLHAELEHLYSDSGAKVAIVAPDYADPAKSAAGEQVEHWLVLGGEYDAALAAASTQRPDVTRTGDDHYVIYTGGTTGRPKGVIWRQEDLLRGALNTLRMGAPLESVEQLAAEAAANENPMTMLACGPMMHGGSQWILGGAHVAGSTVAFYTERNFNPEVILDLVDEAKVGSITFLGDAMGRPVAETVLANPGRWDLSSLVAVSNGAAPLTEGVRHEIRQAFPGRFILDAYGSSESGATSTRMDDGAGSAPGFPGGPDVEVFDPEWAPAAVGASGMLARSGPIPLGYHNDPVKTAATFKEVDGRRWVVPGDFARREADGSITLLGRGSVCINTGGEKVYPEEVEAMLLKHPDVFDAAVVGTPHERWGQQVTALVQLRDGVEADESALVAWAKGEIAGYKVPKRMLFVTQVPRTAVSKIDYAGSARRALELLADA